MSALSFCRSLQLLLTYFMSNHSEVIFCVLQDNNSFLSATTIKQKLTTCHFEHQMGSIVSFGYGFFAGEANETAIQARKHTKPEDPCSPSNRRHIIVPMVSQPTELWDELLDGSKDQVVALDAEAFYHRMSFHAAPINRNMFLLVGSAVTMETAMKPLGPSYTFFEVYRIVHKVVIRRLMMNNFEADEMEKSSLIRRRQDFKQDVVTCTVEIEKYGDMVGTRVHLVNGALAFIQAEAGVPLTYLYFAGLFNFRQNILTGGYFGFQNGTIEGADTLQQLQSGQSQIYLMTPTMTLPRARFLSYLVSSFVQGSIQALFRQPKFSEARNVFFIPFKLHVWLAVIGALAAIIAAVAVTRWLIGPTVSDSDTSFVQNSGIWIIGAFVQQAWDSVPSSQTLRIVAFVGFLTTSLLYNCYSAKILAVFSDSAPAISSIGGLFGSNFVFLGDVGNSFAPQKEIYEKRYRKKISSEKNMTKISQRVWSGKFAYIGFFRTEQLVLPQVTPTEICEQIYVLDMGTISIKNGMMVAKNSSLRSFFNFGYACVARLVKLHESGFLQRFMKQRTHGRCDNSETKIVIEALTIEDVYFAFLISFTGMILGTLFLGSEKIYVARKFFIRKRSLPAITCS